MTWLIKWDDRAIKELRKLHKNHQKEIINYLANRIALTEKPSDFGKPLRGNLSGLWRYRVGDLRIVCRITEGTLTVLVLRVAHRRKIYRN